MKTLLAAPLLVVTLLSFDAVGAEGEDGGMVAGVPDAGFPLDLPSGERVLAGFFAALSLPDEGAAAQAVVPFVHKSLLDKDGRALSADARRFSFKKAHVRAKAYYNPPVVSRTRQSGDVGVGFRETREKGVVVDYFVERKKGESGLPSPIKVFFPEVGGEPKVLFMGSL